MNQSRTRAFQPKRIQENVFLLNWKPHAKIQAVTKENKFYPKSHLHPSCTKPFNYRRRQCFFSLISTHCVCLQLWTRLIALYYWNESWRKCLDMYVWSFWFWYIVENWPNKHWIPDITDQKCLPWVATNNNNNNNNANNKNNSNNNNDNNNSNQKIRNKRFYHCSPIPTMHWHRPDVQNLWATSGNSWPPYLRMPWTCQDRVYTKTQQSWCISLLDNMQTLWHQSTR